MDVGWEQRSRRACPADVRRRSVRPLDDQPMDAGADRVEHSARELPDAWGSIITMCSWSSGAGCPGPPRCWEQA